MATFEYHFGKVVRDAWIKWAEKQPDIAEHPHWLTPFDQLDLRDQEVDWQIAQAVILELSRASQTAWYPSPSGEERQP